MIRRSPREEAADAMMAAMVDPAARTRRERAGLEMPSPPDRADPAAAWRALGYRMLDITFPRPRPLWKRLLRIA